MMMSAVVGVVCAYVYVKCKQKGDVLIWASQHQPDMNFFKGKRDRNQIELEQNSAYQGNKTFVLSLKEDDLEPCPTYEIVH